MRNDDSVTENDADKETLFAAPFATSFVPPAYLVADEGLCEKFLPDAWEQLDPSTMVEIVEILNALMRRKKPSPAVSLT
jgi:hypothetical protein